MKLCNKFCFFPWYHQLKLEMRNVVAQVVDQRAGFREFFTSVATQDVRLAGLSSS
jgi:hypothetical protein